MIKKYYIYFLILLNFTLASVNCQNERAKELEISFAPVKNTFYFGEPIGCTLTIKNVSDNYLSCFACENHVELKSVNEVCGKEESFDRYYYPRFLTGLGSLTFAEKTLPDSVTKRLPLNKPLWVVIPTVKKILAPKETYTTTIYINAYLRFSKPGNFSLTYKLNFPMEGNPSSASATNSGVLHINIEKTSNILLEKTLNSVFQDILTNRDILQHGTETDKMLAQGKIYENLEALYFLDTPNSVKYLGKLLDIDGAEADAIKALSEYRTPEVEDLLISSLLKFKEKNALIVSLIFDEISSNKIVVHDGVIKELLESKNDSTRCVAIKYMSQTGKSSYISLLQPFVNNHNRYLSQSALEAINKLHNNP